MIEKLFNPDFYYEENRDVANTGIYAYEHYVNYGLKEGREACLNFNGLDLQQVKDLYYHAISDDLSFKKTLSNQNLFPFYCKSYIVAHLPVLEFYASLCTHVTEFGVRNGHSTIAFLFGLSEGSKLVSYDIRETPFVRWLIGLNCEKWKFLKKSTIDTAIDATDLIFFDTFHSYDHLKTELTLHAAKSRKFLIFHDTFSCATVCDGDSSKEGIKRAIDEYVQENPCRILYKTDTCNGLLVLEKVF